MKPDFSYTKLPYINLIMNPILLKGFEITKKKCNKYVKI